MDVRERGFEVFPGSSITAATGDVPFEQPETVADKHLQKPSTHTVNMVYYTISQLLSGKEKYEGTEGGCVCMCVLQR